MVCLQCKNCVIIAWALQRWASYDWSTIQISLYLWFFYNNKKLKFLKRHKIVTSGQCSGQVTAKDFEPRFEAVKTAAFGVMNKDFCGFIISSLSHCTDLLKKQNDNRTFFRGILVYKVSSHKTSSSSELHTIAEFLEVHDGGKRWRCHLSIADLRECILSRLGVDQRLVQRWLDWG